MTAQERALKVLDPSAVQELEAMSPDQLKATIVQANQAMQQVREELDANERYQETREQLKAMTAGKREVDRYQKAKIALALELLKAAG